MTLGYLTDVRPCTLCGADACRHNTGRIARMEHMNRRDRAGHTSCGRGNTDSGPDESDCGCRRGPLESDCAKAGCGFCRVGV